MNRRTFITIGSLAFGTGFLGKHIFAQESSQQNDSTESSSDSTTDMHMEHTVEDTQDIDNLNSVLEENLGIDFSAFEASNKLKIIAPEFAESGASVPVEIEVLLPMEDVKAIHIFVDQNPLPHIMTAQLGPKSTKPVFSTKIRVSQVSPIRAVAETVDGKYLLTSQVIAVANGGCG